LSVLKMNADTSLGGTPEDRIALRTALAEYLVWGRERLVTHNKEVDDLGVEVDEKVKVEQSTQEQLVSSSSFSSDTTVQALEKQDAVSDSCARTAFLSWWTSHLFQHDQVLAQEGSYPCLFLGSSSSFFYL
jgi:hypothetical protein